MKGKFYILPTALGIALGGTSASLAVTNVFFSQYQTAAVVSTNNMTSATATIDAAP